MIGQGVILIVTLKEVRCQVQTLDHRPAGVETFRGVSRAAAILVAEIVRRVVAFHTLLALQHIVTAAVNGFE